jgi:ATP-dependent helicase HrpA
VVEVLALEHRVRRDLLVDDAVLEAFFDARVPERVTTGRRFDQWWKDERARRPDLLTYTRDLLIDPSAGPVDAAGFPEWVRAAGLDLPLTYTDEPGAELDGVTIDVPLLALDKVEEARLDWQVPGLRRDLVEALIRTLAKDVRRQLGPAPDAARAVLAETDPADGALLDVLPGALARRSGVAVSFPGSALEQVPDHLRVTYRVVDDRGRPLAWSKDLAALRARMADRVRVALAAAAPLAEVAGLLSWTVGTIPRSVDAEHGGTRVTGYPALVDEGDTVALRVLASAGEQQTAMWGGTRRLLLLQLGSPLRTLDKALSNATKLAVARSRHMRAAEVYLESAEAAVDQLLLEAGGPAWDEAGFEALLAGVRSRFAATAVSAATLVGEVLATVTAVEERLGTMLAPALDETVVDVEAHVARLVRPGWVTTSGLDRLPDVARYARAVEHRLGKAVAQPARDRARLIPIRSLERDYARLGARDLDGSVRTMLEELRVSTFAQPVGARGGVSEQKVRRALARLGV